MDALGLRSVEGLANLTRQVRQRDAERLRLGSNPQLDLLRPDIGGVFDLVKPVVTLEVLGEFIRSRLHLAEVAPGQPEGNRRTAAHAHAGGKTQFLGAGDFANLGTPPHFYFLRAYLSVLTRGQRDLEVAPATVLYVSEQVLDDIVLKTVFSLDLVVDFPQRRIHLLHDARDERLRRTFLDLHVRRDEVGLNLRKEDNPNPAAQNQAEHENGDADKARHRCPTVLDGSPQQRHVYPRDE